MELDILIVKKDYEEYNSYISNFPKFSLEMPMSFGRMYGYTIHILDSGKIELREGKASNENSNCDIMYVSNCPSELEPVLAKIEHINSLGKSSWYEVVYFDGNWRCYAGSSTFKDGEKVVKWRYCKDCC